MNTPIKSCLAGLALAVSLVGTAVAGPLEDGLAAVRRGDGATALKLWRPLADRGNVEAQFYLGVVYDEGWGLPEDDAQAVIWYRRAASQGHAQAQFILGSHFEEGQGVPQDYAQAAVWYGKAADQGNAQAQNSLGDLYYAGMGLPKDYAQAAVWYRKAADQGNIEALSSLGVDYEEGLGLPQDKVQAYKWFAILALRVNGDMSGSEFDRVATDMTTAQVAEAQRLAQEWVAQWEVLHDVPWRLGD